MVEDKVEYLVMGKRVPEAIEQCKKLFHLSTSFVSSTLRAPL